MRPARIELFIEELLVDGADLKDPAQLGPALEQELARLMNGQGSQSQLIPGRSMPSVETQIANVVYERVAGVQDTGTKEQR